MPKHCLVTDHSNPQISHTHKSHYIISKAITEIPLGQKLLDIKLDLLYLPQKKLTYICNNVNDLVPTTG